MSQKQLTELKPFLSLLMVIITLFSMVFFKMEVRRMGYSVLREAREYKTLQDRHRSRTIEYAKQLSPSRLTKVAQRRLTLEEARQGQIIQLTGDGIALPQ